MRVPHVPVAGLRCGLGVVLLAGALGVASKAGADIGPGVILGVPAAVGVIAWLIHRRRPARRAQPATSAASSGG